MKIDIKNRKVYEVKDLMEILCVSRGTVYKILDKNEFPVIRLEKLIRIPKEPFDRWLNNSNNLAS